MKRGPEARKWAVHIEPLMGTDLVKLGVGMQRRGPGLNAVHLIPVARLDSRGIFDALWKKTHRERVSRWGGGGGRRAAACLKPSASTGRTERPGRAWQRRPTQSRPERPGAAVACRPQCRAPPAAGSKSTWSTGSSCLLRMQGECGGECGDAAGRSLRAATTFYGPFGLSPGAPKKPQSPAHGTSCGRSVPAAESRRGELESGEQDGKKRAKAGSALSRPGAEQGRQARLCAHRTNDMCLADGGGGGGGACGRKESEINRLFAALL